MVGTFPDRAPAFNLNIGEQRARNERTNRGSSGRSSDWLAVRAELYTRSHCGAIALLGRDPGTDTARAAWQQVRDQSKWLEKTEIKSPTAGFDDFSNPSSV